MVAGGRQLALALATLMALPASLAVADETPRRGVLFLTMEGPTARSLGLGGKLALNGEIDKSGPLIMLTVSTSGAAMLAGWQTTLPKAVIGVYSGIERADNGRIGARVFAEIFARPFDTLSASLVATCGSARRDCWSRGRLGWAIGALALGPEVIVASDRMGGGLALTGMRWRGIEAELAAGFLKPRHRASGAYGSLALIRRF